MPNYCQNILIVSGPEADVSGFIDVARGETANGVVESLSFQRLRPMPTSEIEQAEESEDYWSVKAENESIANGATHSSPPWYHWRLKHWGTKWDVRDVHLERWSPSTVAFSFDTAWSPPLELVEYVGKKYPNLCFELQWQLPDVPGWAARTLCHGEGTITQI